MKNLEKCVLCGSEKLDIVLNNCKDLEYNVENNFDFLFCNECKLLMLNPQPSEEELVNYYPDNYHCYDFAPSKITQILYDLVYYLTAKKIKKLIGSKGRILDIGCADGHSFDLLNKYGNWDFTGLEFNDKIAAKGRSKGRNIIISVLEDFETQEKYDLIIMNHMIEHVTEPVKFMLKAKKLLNQKGYIIGETPNWSSLDFYLFKKYWGGLHTPRHPILFNKNSFEFLCKKCSFKIIDINFLLHTGHWALSIQNFFQNYSLSKFNLKNGRAFYYSILLLILLPFNVIQKIFNFTGTFGFIIMKK